MTKNESGTKFLYFLTDSFIAVADSLKKMVHSFFAMADSFLISADSAI
jgi:hypothetical protein